MDDGGPQQQFPSPFWTAVLLGLASVILVGITAAVVIAELG